MANTCNSRLEEAKTALSKEASNVEIRLLVVDFSDLENVKSKAEEVLEWGMPIDSFINNAAVVSCLPILS